jgi:hypothetical protein
MFVCNYVCMNVCMSTHTHTHAHTHTHTHIQGHSEIGQMKQAMFWAGLYGGMGFSTLVLLLFLASIFPANSPKSAPIRDELFPANSSIGMPIRDNTVVGVEGTPVSLHLSPAKPWRKSPVGGALFVFRGEKSSVCVWYYVYVLKNMYVRAYVWTTYVHICIYIYIYVYYGFLTMRF